MFNDINSANNPFEADYKEKCEKYERQIEQMKDEQNAKIALTIAGTAVICGLVYSIDKSKTIKKYNKQLATEWQSGYDIGCGITSLAAQNYINGINDGIKALPGATNK